MKKDKKVKNILKSILAVLAGFIIIVLLSVMTDSILENTGVIPKGKLPLHGAELMILGIVGYRAIFSVIGCFLTAKLAPSNPMRHALLLGGIGVVFSLLGGLAMKNAAPLWYTLILVIMSLPLAWLGGRLARSH